MTTVTVKIDDNNKEAKALVEYLKKLSFVKIEKKKSEEEVYNPEFVNKVLNAHKNDKRVVIDIDKLWESI